MIRALTSAMSGCHRMNVDPRLELTCDIYARGYYSTGSTGSNAVGISTCTIPALINEILSIDIILIGQMPRLLYWRLWLRNLPVIFTLKYIYSDWSIGLNDLGISTCKILAQIYYSDWFTGSSGLEKSTCKILS